MEDDKLDSFLNAVDDDPDWSSDEEDNHIHRRIEAESKAAASAKKNATPETTTKAPEGLTFEDLFGSPVKKKKEPVPSTIDGEFFEALRKKEMEGNLDIRAKEGRFQNTGPMPSTSASASQSSLKPVPAPLVFTKSNNPTSLANGSSSTSDAIMDPYSRISIFKSSVNLYCDNTMSIEAVLKDRNLGIHYVNLLGFDNWYKSNGGKDGKKFWTSGIVARKLGMKQSANGNDYTIWELNDLKDLEKAWSLFIFGSAATSTAVSSIPVGSFIDIVTPSVMTANNAPLKLSVNNSNQIRHIATARYFGYCSGKRKDGTNCTAVVNIIECPVCIHHASKELRKLNSKGKPTAANKITKNKQGGNPRFSQDSEESQAGVKTVNFGATAALGTKPKPRMELQGGLIKMDRNSIRLGNHSSISFEQPKNDLPKLEPKVKPLLKLDPARTKHLTEKDRQILESLGAKKRTSDLPEMLATVPNAGARNYLQYLAEEQYKLDKARQNKLNTEQVTGFGKPLHMSQAVLASMKQALNYVKTKGPIKKADPNKVGVSSTDRKRKLSVESPSTSAASSPGSSSLSGSVKKRKSMANIEVEFDFESDEFKKILNAKSKHEKVLEEIQQDEYFDKLEKKEAVENKLLNTFKIDTTAVMCQQCKYIALSKSDLCKELNHTVKIVKAVKRFFKCKDCGNRTMSLDRLPKKPCSNCKSSSWLSAPVGKERKGPTLESETLCIRGDEEKFLGSSGGKLFLSNIST